MSDRLDVAFLGRAPNPVVVRTARQIRHEARWGWLIFVGKVVGTAVGFLLFAAAWMLVGRG